MRVVIQRVKQSSVTIDGEVVSKIGTGLMILVGLPIQVPISITCVARFRVCASSTMRMVL